jgi:GxxExxY protein
LKNLKEKTSENKELLYRELSFAIIGAAIEVHKVLGHGFLESVYQAALAEEFHRRGIDHKQQVELPIQYKGKTIGIFRADFLVEDKIIVELKATHNLTEVDEAQLLNYLHASGYRIGLLFNFGASSLEKLRRAL